VAVEIGVQHQFPKHKLGELYVDEDGNYFRYMQADGAVTKNLLYSYRPVTWQIEEYIKLATDPATAEVMCACASPVTMTDNYYAWVFVGPGTVTLTTASGVAADAIIYGVNGNGTVDDAAVALLLDGLTCPVTIVGATTGSFYAARPMIALDLA
jgi:hypothetical protein